MDGKYRIYVTRLRNGGKTAGWLMLIIPFGEIKEKNVQITDKGFYYMLQQRMY